MEATQNKNQLSPKQRTASPIMYGTTETIDGKTYGKPAERGNPDNNNLWTVEFKNGDFYEGSYTGCQRHGLGTQKYSDGSTFKGNWEFDKKNGKGIFIDKDGDVHAQEWENDQNKNSTKIESGELQNWSKEKWEEHNSKKPTNSIKIKLSELLKKQSLSSSK